MTFLYPGLQPCDVLGTSSIPLVIRFEDRAQSIFITPLRRSPDTFVHPRGRPDFTDIVWSRETSRWTSISVQNYKDGSQRVAPTNRWSGRLKTSAFRLGARILRIRSKTYSARCLLWHTIRGTTRCIEFWTRNRGNCGTFPQAIPEQYFSGTRDAAF